MPMATYRNEWQSVSTNTRTSHPVMLCTALSILPIPPRCLRTLGGEGSAGPRALGLKRRSTRLEVSKLDQAMHLAKAAAGVVSALGRQVLGLGIHVLHHHLGAVLALGPRGLGAPKLGNKAVEGEGLVILRADGLERRLGGVAPGAPVLGGLVEARPARRLAEGIQGLSKWGRNEIGGEEAV